MNALASAQEKQNYIKNAPGNWRNSSLPAWKNLCFTIFLFSKNNVFSFAHVENSKQSLNISVVQFSYIEGEVNSLFCSLGILWNLECIVNYISYGIFCCTGWKPSRKNSKQKWAFLANVTEPQPESKVLVRKLVCPCSWDSDAFLVASLFSVSLSLSLSILLFLLFFLCLSLIPSHRRPCPLSAFISSRFTSI